MEEVVSIEIPPQPAPPQEEQKASGNAKPPVCLCGQHTTVTVEARTWPGINKPGGVGRITKINENGTYNIKYLLGGSEKEVDRCFIFCPDGEMSKRDQKAPENFMTEVFDAPVQKRHKPQRKVINENQDVDDEIVDQPHVPKVKDSPAKAPKKKCLQAKDTNRIYEDKQCVMDKVVAAETSIPADALEGMECTKEIEEAPKEDPVKMMRLNTGKVHVSSVFRCLNPEDGALVEDLRIEVNKAMKDEPFCEAEFQDLLRWMDTQNYIFYSNDMVYPI